MTDTNELMRDIDRALVAIDASKPYTYQPTTSMPALSPQMQAALDAEAEMVAKVLKRAREMEAELIAARADLREAMELLEAHGQPPDWMVPQTWLSSPTPWRDWTRRYGALLAKHKETP